MENISIFKNLVDHQTEESFEHIFNQIQNDTFKNQIENIRLKLKKGKTVEADKLKKSLPAFTTSGSFLNGRKAKLITTYSQYIILDIDDLMAINVETVKNKAALAPYTYCAFISPSGLGIKVIAKTNANLEQHHDAYIQLCNYYEIALETTIDQSGKDVSRLCFFSHDPEIFINSSASVYEINLSQEEEIPFSKREEPVPTDWSKTFNEAIVFTERKSTYTEGNRNNFIHLLTCNCNRKGIPVNDTFELIKSRYDLPISEIEASIKNVYQNNAQEFASDTKSAKSANLQSDDDNTLTKDYLKDTPIIPQSVYETLPDILKITSDNFNDDERKRDVFLTSALVVLSGCLPNVTGIYHQETVFTHLFSFVVAPAASGKGVLKNAKRLGDKIHERLLEESKYALKEYDKQKTHYELLKRNYKGEGEAPEKPEIPPFKLLFIPGDSSQAKILELLRDNDGKGIICETEADTVSGANKQDWGNYSPILRGGFHHEKISVSRKTDNLLIEIPSPCIAVALSGTPNQVGRLIASAEDGLFSRFIFYAFKSEIVWRNPAPVSHKKTLNQLFDEASTTILQIHDVLIQYPIQMTLSQTQWSKLNQSFEGKLNNVALFTGEDAISVVFRLGLIAFRFCMIFTALRRFENADTSNNLQCEEQDFENALVLSDVYLQHSLLIFNNLSGDEKKTDYKIPDNKQRFFDALPTTIFQRKEAVEIGKSFDLSARTVDCFLRASVPSILTLVKTGYYQKFI
ncbi:DUF3987 domain-containing protein [Pedobacter cryophilus]|uniref:DUF3987 domain-containing protein n=1 Tax=Pedobacter cryophilus TaxID=2571271 RepID=A0A4U1C2Y3_9SPHI|nr:DUF3987 domain-containing protein [Pedobacter cryophilus]TKC00176.1 DUF3987 domain-containing protein [Pedobacter cryophilus]